MIYVMQIMHVIEHHLENAEGCRIASITRYEVNRG